MRISWPGLALGLAACGVSGSVNEPIGPGDGGAPCGATSLVLGSGVVQYQPVHDGDTVALYSGPQGGFMIYFSVRASGLDPADDEFCYTETFTTGAALGYGCWRVILTNDLGGGVHERVGIWGQIDASFWHTPELVRGQDIRVDTTLTDRNGCAAQAGWTLVHVSPEPGH
jgi:hypothetical protein